MDDSDPAGTDLVSIACDPTNYDWNELDQDVSTNQQVEVGTAIANAITTDPGLAATANGHTNIWRSRPFSDSDFTNVPSSGSIPHGASNRTAWPSNPTRQPRQMRQKATDKDVVDFMYGESANETMMRLSNEFVPIVEPGADTLIHIGPPPQIAGQTDHEYSYVRRQFERPYLLRSDTLRKLNSAKFLDLLGPRSARTQRRLQKAGIHKLVLEPQNIKYFIDLTPNIHDDEGMILLTELSAPHGARAWHQNARRYNISASHVCGRDTLDVPPRPLYRPQSQDGPGPELEDQNQTAKPKDTKKFSGAGSDPSNEEQPVQEKKANNASDYDLPQEDDYSQLRHYTAIARLLHAVAGQDPKLNSAPKVWTFCMLAKFFDCAKSNLVNRWVIDWLVQANNLNFIQRNPSTAYRLGMAIEAIWLVRTSFSIMVGQKAFASNAGDSKHLSAFPFEPPSLITEDLDDDEINRVDHAVLALVRRINDSLNDLLRADGKWLNHPKPSSELHKFYQLELKDPNARSVLEVAKTCLKGYIQRLLCSALVEVDYSKKTSGDSTQSSSNIAKLYNDVPSLARPLTLPFWELLQKEDFSVDHADQGHYGNHKYWARTLENLIKDGVIAPEMIDIPYVSKTELSQAVDSLNTLPFYPRPEDKESSPTKRAKLSPQQETTHSPSIASKDFPDCPQSPISEKPAVRLTDASTQDSQDTQSRRRYSWESDSYWDEDSGLKDEIPHEPETDDWEDVLVDLEAQSESKIPAEAMAAQDIPIRNKFPVSQVSPVQASIQENAVQATAQFEKFSIMEQDYQELLHGTASIQTQKRKQNSPVTESQHRDRYGNLVSPQPSKSFPVLPVNDGTTRQPLLKSGTNCGSCSQRRFKCDESYPTCGQCSRRGFVCNYNLQNPSETIQAERSRGFLPDANTYAQPSTYLGPQYKFSHYKPLKTPLDTVDANYLKTGFLVDGTDVRHSSFSNLVDTKPLPDNMFEAIQESNRHRPFDSRVQSSRLRVTNPDVTGPAFSTIKQPEILPQRDHNLGDGYFFFYLTTLLIEVNDCVSRFVRPLITPGYVADQSCAYEIPINDVGVLTSLSQDEYKYLPLWAGGNDDGTGGVFNDGDDIPEAPEVEYGGFRGGAMGIIPGVGSSIGGSMAGSEFEEIMTEVGVSTVGKASRIATDGEETVMSLDE